MFENMIDIHSHILCGLDDGARNLGESEDLAFCAEDSGTGVLFATPHLIYWDKADELYDARERSLYDLRGVLDESDSDLILKKGFEILCDDEIFSVKHFLPYTLNQSRYILIEFSFSKATDEDVVAWCDYLKSFGLVPVIAHPERYDFVKDDPICLNRLSEKGALFQINAGSPAGAFGETEMQISNQMINCGFVDFIGSDAHRIRMRNTDMSFYFGHYPESADMSKIRKAAVENPEFILNDTLYIPKRTAYITTKN